MSISPEAMDANLVLTLDEITSLAKDGGKPADTLMNVVALIASRFRTDVCSAYLLEPDRSNLVLAATLGLHPRCIGTLRMPLHEGLAGLVAEQVRPVAVDDASQPSALQVLQGIRRRGVSLVPRRSAHRSRHSAGRSRRADQGAPRLSRSEIRMLAEAARPGRARRQRSPHPRPLHRPRAGAALGSGPQRLVELGPRLRRASFAISIPRAGAQLNQNPIALLNEMPLGEIERRATELVLHSRINYVYRRQQEYLHADRTWGAANAGVLRPRPVAYFSAEFGLHESLPIYSGGLGVLAGDHIKSASDLDIPLVGIGLFYGQGYFLQRLDEKGWQREEYLADRHQPAAHAARHRRSTASRSSLRSPPAAAAIRAKVWRVKVGRCDLLLLDSNVPGNAPEDLDTTSRLYGGDARTRIRQELLLGVGGFRALKAMGITPGVLHLNEGHSGFAVFEAIRSRMEEEGLDFYAAASQIPREVIFTTHTPVPAGHDRFSPDLIEEHLGPLREQLGISHENLMGFGREHPTDHGEPFCMTVLGLKLARRVNAVSSLHGEVSRAMWKDLYPGTPEDAVPIGHITNGVHVPSWLAPQMCRLYDRHLGVGLAAAQRRQAAPGKPSKTSTTASSGRRTSA